MRALICNKLIRFFPKGKTGGFTLVEILIAAALSAVILSSLYWSYSTVVGTTRRYRQVSNYYQTARIVLSNMAREIGGAFQPLFTEDVLLFEGADNWFKGMEYDELSFVTTTCLRGGEEESGYDTFELTFSLDYGKEGYLLMTRAPCFNPEEPFEEGEELILAENIRALNFEYFDGEEWWEEWNPEEQEYLPRAIRITIAVGGEDEDEPRRFTTAAWLPQAFSEEEEEEENDEG